MAVETWDSSPEFDGHLGGSLSVKAIDKALGATSESPILNIGGLTTGQLYIVATAVSGTSPTLDVDLEEYDPASGTWFTHTRFTQVTGVTTEKKSVTNLPQIVRFKYTIGGTDTPTVTFSLGAVFK